MQHGIPQYTFSFLSSPCSCPLIVNQDDIFVSQRKQNSLHLNLNLGISQLRDCFFPILKILGNKLKTVYPTSDHLAVLHCASTKMFQKGLQLLILKTRPLMPTSFPVVWVQMFKLLLTIRGYWTESSFVSSVCLSLDNHQIYACICKLNNL